MSLGILLYFAKWNAMNLFFAFSVVFCWNEMKFGSMK
jgi:hypothetical protein